MERGQTVALLHDFCRLDEEPFAIVSGVDGIVTVSVGGDPDLGPRGLGQVLEAPDVGLGGLGELQRLDRETELQ